MSWKSGIWIFVFLLGVSGCSRSTSTVGPQSVIPKNWIIPDENADADIHPDAKMDAAVKNAFRLNSAAMDGIGDGGEDNQPGDWMPWHLSGIIASFAVSADGFFGPLVYDGTPSIKGTWTPRVQSPAPVVHSSGKSALTISRQTTSADVASQLEPAIQAVLASGHGGDEKNLRTAILKYAEEFRVVSQMLSSTQLPGWEVENYRLELNISASGLVTPVIGAGAAVNLRFDWEKPVQSELGIRSETPMSGFVQALSQEIQAAANLATPIKSAGFQLNEFRIGVGISSAGNLGIAQEQGNAVGSITFCRREAGTVQEGQNPATLNLIRAQNDHPLERAKFRRGLSRAIKMGSYFARMSKNENPNSKWEISEIEAEFDLSAGGTLGLATTSGLGVAVLTFAKEGL